MIRQHSPSACTASKHGTNSLTRTHSGDRDGRKRSKDKHRPTAQSRGGGGGHKMVTTLYKPIAFYGKIYIHVHAYIYA